MANIDGSATFCRRYALEDRHPDNEYATVWVCDECAEYEIRNGNTVSIVWLEKSAPNGDPLELLVRVDDPEGEDEWAQWINDPECGDDPECQVCQERHGDEELDEEEE